MKATLTPSQAPCRNCNELIIECACKRNKCIECGKPVGNITFTVCDTCWDVLETKRIEKIVPVQEEVPELAHLQQQLKEAKEKIEAQGNLLKSVWEKYIKIIPAKDLADLIDLMKQVQTNS